MTVQQPFSKSEREIARFMSREKPVYRVYLYNPLDAQAKAEDAKRNQTNVVANMVKTPDGNAPFTRYVDLKESQYKAFQKSGGISGIARESEGEIVVGGNPMNELPQDFKKAMSADTYLGLEKGIGHTEATKSL